MQALQGTFAFFPCATLFRHLWERRATGLLVARRSGDEKRLGLDRGEVVYAVSNHPGEYLGRMLVEAGHLNEEAFLRAHRAHQETHVPLGRILAMTDAVPEAIIRETLERKFLRAGADLLSWEDGAFTFTLQEPPGERDLAASVSIDRLLDEAPPPQAPPREEEGAWRGWFPTRELEPPPGDRTTGGDPLGPAKEALAAGHAEEALRLLEEAGKEGRTREIVALMRTAEEGLLVRLRAELLEGEPRPRTTIDRAKIRKLPFTPPERYLLLRMDGQRSLEGLLQIAPIRQVDALRFVRKVLDEGLIRY